MDMAKRLFKSTKKEDVWAAALFSESPKVRVLG